jgi:hypothetical protein
MRNFSKLVGVIALVMAITFTITACIPEDESNNGGGGGNGGGIEGGDVGGDNGNSITLSLGKKSVYEFKMTVTGTTWNSSVSAASLSSFLIFEKEVGTVDSIDFILAGATVVRLTDTVIEVTLTESGHQSAGTCKGNIKVKESQNIVGQNYNNYVFQNLPTGIVKVTRAANSESVNIVMVYN